MSLPLKAVVVCFLSFLVSGCAGVPGKVTRAYEAPLTFHSYQNPDVEMQAQARALEEMASDLVRRATLRGAATGVVVGCGTALISAGGLKSCASGAVVAGGVGGITGYRKGKAQVADSVHAARIDELDQHIAGLKGQTDRVTGDLSTFLARQDAELARLKSEAEAGRIPEDALIARIGQIRETRSQLALTLAKSASDVVKAREEMLATSSRQSVDLHGQIQITRQLETDLFKTQSAISLI